MRDILFEWNPWWEKQFTFQQVKRDLFTHIQKWIERKEIIAIIGARRSGKTTLLYEVISYLINTQHVKPKNIFFLKADDDRVDTSGLITTVMNEYYKWKNPQGKTYVFIDEIHEIAEWQKPLKRFYDLHQQQKKFFISGSNASLLKEDLSYLLTGRFAYFELYPFNFIEFLRAQHIKISKETDLIRQKNTLRNLLINYIEYGGFPEIVLEHDSDRKDELLRFYFESILYRDIVKRKNIRNVDKLDKLVKWYLQNIASSARYEKLGKLCELSTDSVGEYTRYFEDAYLIFAINILAYSLKKQYINPKKIYCIDPGLRRIVGVIFSKDAGRLYENIVYVHLKQLNKEIFYWKNKNECDFVVQHQGTVKQAIQVSYEIKENKEREVKGLLDAMETFQLDKGLIITQDMEKQEIIDGYTVDYVPLWKWLLFPEKNQK